MHFLPLAVRYDGAAAPTAHGYQVHVGPMYAATRGEVMIQSDDPFAKPQIRFNYLSTPNDRKEWVEAVRTAREVLRLPAFDGIIGGEFSPGPRVRSADDILSWVRRDAETALHPCGTALMGIGENSVVRPQTMSVHSIDGLQVVDASVMQFITNGNITAPTLKIAEQSAA